jgi:hypothetical protein
MDRRRRELSRALQANKLKRKREEREPIESDDDDVDESVDKSSDEVEVEVKRVKTREPLSDVVQVLQKTPNIQNRQLIKSLLDSTGDVGKKISLQRFFKHLDDCLANGSLTIPQAIKIIQSDRSPVKKYSG